jgi:hypothetical protein
VYKTVKTPFISPQIPVLEKLKRLTAEILIQFLKTGIGTVAVRYRYRYIKNTIP